MIMTPESRARLDAHLDAVEAALARAGNTREQRRGIVDDLEAQAVDMLAHQGAEPTPADVEAVLAKLDPPEAYGAGAAGAERPAGPASSPVQATPPVRKYSRTAIWALVCVLASLVPLAAFLLTGFLYLRESRTHDSVPEPVRLTTTYQDFLGQLDRKHFRSIVALERGDSVLLTGTYRRPAPEGAGSPLHEVSARVPANEMDGAGWTVLRDRAQAAGTTLELLPNSRAQGSIRLSGVLLIVLAAMAAPLAILGTILGWLAFSQIRRSQGTLQGKGLAIFAGTFYPAVTMWLLVMWS